MSDFLRLNSMFVVIPLLLTAVGVLFIGNSVWSVIRARLFLKVAEQVSGTVSEHRFRVRRGSDHDRIVTVPVLRFTTRAGQQVDAEQSILLRGGGAPSIGTEVSVLYDPGDPSRVAMAGSRSGITAASVGGIVFGIVFTLIASNFLTPWALLVFR